MIIMILLFCVFWYLIGFISFLAINKISFGKVLIKDVIVSFIAGFGGPYILLWLILEIAGKDDIEFLDKKLF